MGGEEEGQGEGSQVVGGKGLAEGDEVLVGKVQDGL